MNNNYKIIRTIYENVFQRVLECKDNKTDEIFYSNVIMNNKVINLINLDTLKNLSTNIMECYGSPDRLYIFTKPLKTKANSLKDYVLTNELKIKQQFDITRKLIEFTCEIYNMTDSVQQKILDLDKIYIDNNGKLIADCNLIFEQEYDISENETFQDLGNIIHFIFSKTEIVDYNISELIPPDILKIIVRCLTKEYMHPKDALKELLNSPLYNMIASFPSKEGKNADNPKILSAAGKIDDASNDINQTNKQSEYNKFENNVGKIEKKEKNKKAIVEAALGDEENSKIFNEELQDKVIFDIYVNDNRESENEDGDYDKKFVMPSKDFILKAVVSIILVILVLFAGKFIMNKFNDSKKVSAVPDTATSQGLNTSVSNGETADTVSKYLNDDLLKNVGYTGEKAQIDNEIYAEGNKSLVISNDSSENKKILFAAVDFTNENYSYMLKKQIAVSAKVKSQTDVSALVVLEAYKGGKLATTFNSSVEIYDDMWSQIMVPINMSNADSLNVYIEYSGENKIWIDSVLIDVIK